MRLVPGWAVVASLLRLHAAGGPPWPPPWLSVQSLPHRCSTPLTRPAAHVVLQVPGAKPFPAGTIVSAAQVFPGQLAQCTGRFPYPNPAPYALPANGVQLFQAPNGGKCAGQFSRFYQGLGPDGGFVVQCTN